MCASLYIALLVDKLDEYTYDFDIADLQYAVKHLGRGVVRITFVGYNQKLPMLIECVCTTFRTLDVTKLQDRFDIMKNRQLRLLRNYTKNSSYSHCLSSLDCMIRSETFQKHVTIAAAEKCQLADVHKWKEQFFGGFFMEGFAHGNLTAEETKALGGQVEKWLDYGVVNPEDWQRGRVWRQPQGESVVWQMKHPNKDDPTSSVVNRYQYKEVEENLLETTTLCVGRLFGHISSPSCFAQLRTKEQLGYQVWSRTAVNLGVLDFQVIIQGTADCVKIDTSVEKWLTQVRGEIDKMTADEFNGQRDGLVKDILKRPTNLSELSAIYWREIDGERYHFHRKFAMAETMKKVTKEMLLEFVDTYLVPGAPKRSKLSYRVHKTPADDKIFEQPIENLTKPVMEGFETVEKFQGGGQTGSLSATSIQDSVREH